MSRYIYFTKLKHLIFLNGGSIYVFEIRRVPAREEDRGGGRQRGWDEVIQEVVIQLVGCSGSADG
jgi:hypothetical protein